MSADPTGYSGTPLARKLGSGAGSRVTATNAPPDYVGLLQPLPDGVVFEAAVSRLTDIVHLFARSKLPLGFVDVKVCAVDATWSGLKLVVRRELR